MSIKNWSFQNNNKKREPFNQQQNEIETSTALSWGWIQNDADLKFLKIELKRNIRNRKMAQRNKLR